MPARCRCAVSGENQNSFGIGHRHAAVHFVVVLHDLSHVIVQAGAKAHLARRLADLVEALAHGLEGASGELRRRDSAKTPPGALRRTL